MAHWKEMMIDADKKIGRPRQLFMGDKDKKDIIDID